MKWSLTALSLITLGTLTGCDMLEITAPINRYYQTDCNNKCGYYNTYDFYNYVNYDIGEKYVPEYYVGDFRAGQCNGGQCQRRGDIY